MHGGANAMLILLPVLLALRFLIVFLRRGDKRGRIVATKNFEEVQKLGSIKKPFQVQATWRNERLEFVTREVEVCAVEGHFAPESNSWMISHIVMRPPGGGATELMGYWRLWHMQDTATGEVAGDIHAFLLSRAGLPPAPYPFVFEKFDVRVPDQPIYIEYTNKDDDETRAIPCALTRVEVRNSGVEGFVVSRPNPGSKVPPKPLRLLRSKITLVSLRPDSETATPVTEPWEWLLRIAREWRPLDDQEAGSGEGQENPQRRDAEAEVGLI